MSRRHPLAPGPADAGPLEARVRAALALGARHRRLAAALCAGASVLAAVSALTPAPVAAPVEGSVGAPARLALPAGAGAEPPGPGERVAVTVRLADPAGVLLLRRGVHVEVVAGAPAGAAEGGATVLAEDAVVIDVPAPVTDDDPSGALLGAGAAGGGDTLAGVVVLSVPRADAHRLAGAAGVRPLAVTVGLPLG